MVINPVSVNLQPKIRPISFASTAKEQNNNQETKKEKRKNPIIPGFEYLDATKATMLASVAAVGRLTLWAMEAGVDIVDLAEGAKEKASKTGILGKKHQGLKLISYVGLGIAGIYFLTHLPKNLYNKKKEVFVKKKEWDVYERTNSAEKQIYEKMDKEAKTASEERKNELAKNWLKMRTAKNQVPFTTYIINNQ